MQNRYQLQHNLFWGQEFDQLEQEVNLPGQPMGSRACSENSAENFNATAVINKLQELEDIEEINEQVAMTSKKCCKCIIL